MGLYFIGNSYCSIILENWYYKQRMGIEEMFRDCKTGGYDLEGTSLKGNRLIKIILLVTIAYSPAIFEGTHIRKNPVVKYVCQRQ